MQIVNFRRHSIVYYSYILLFIVLFFYGLYHARSFLIPVSLAALFAMLFWPVSRYLENKGMSRAGAAGVCVFILLLLLVGLLLFFASQVAGFSSQMSNLQSQLTSMFEQVRQFFESNLGINIQNYFSGGGTESGAAGTPGSGAGAGSTIASDTTAASGTRAGQTLGSDTTAASGTGTGGGQTTGSDTTRAPGAGAVAGVLSTAEGAGEAVETGGTGGFNFQVSNYLSTIMSSLKKMVMFTFKTLVGLVVITVYFFLMLLYRHILIEFVQKLSKQEQKEESAKVTKQVSRISQQYLAGRFIVIGIVAVINSVGLTLIGIKQGIFFGVLAALLDLIPYIGIIIGAGLPLIMSLLNHQKLWPFFAVLGLFVFVQLLENYYLTPKIVGSHVRLNPIFTIMAVLIGGYLWGVAGMILFIPFLAMLKVIFDHIPPLHPYGFLVGDPDNRTEKKG